MSDKLKDLERRLKNIRDSQRSTIQNFCNAVGCKDCPLHIDYETNQCTSTDLQGQEFELMEEIDDQRRLIAENQAERQKNTINLLDATYG